MSATTTPDPGRDRYRRGQRRRARIAWAVLGLLVVGIGLAIAFGGNDGESSDGTSVSGLLPAEMSASAYTAIHKGQTEVDAAKEVEGRHTRLLYLAPRGRSSLEVFRNYETDLAAKGFAVLWKCSGEDECEPTYGTGLSRVLYPPTKTLQSNELAKVAFNVPIEPRYLAATVSRPEGDVAVSLYVATESGAAFPDTKDRVAVLLDVVEAKPMEAKMVTVDAATMAKDISTTGKVAITALLRHRQGRSEAGHQDFHWGGEETAGRHLAGGAHQLRQGRCDAADVTTNGHTLPSWPGLTRPSRLVSTLVGNRDARHEAGHDAVR